MATYAIGDIQGCYQSLRKLLNKIGFRPGHDRLLLAGDLINRGPQSLETMQFVLQNQDSIQCVLGNHDLHYLAVANHCQTPRKSDTFQDILNSAINDEICYWLSRQPLAHFEPEFNALLVHAGLPNTWSIKEVLSRSNEVSKTLQSAARYQFYVSMYGNQPDQWSDSLAGVDRLRFITNALTRMRYCRSDGRLELTDKSAPKNPADTLVPWFEFNNSNFDGKILFGHWAALQGVCERPRHFALDTGCVWGGQLTALRLNDVKRFTVNAV
jgi:bis(5'-nucleosyl)-tetraphosphatase (symmetrical)